MPTSPFSRSKAQPIPTPTPNSKLKPSSSSTTSSRSNASTSPAPALSTTPPQPQPLRPSMTPPNPPHSHTTRSTRQASAKASLLNVLASGLSGHQGGQGEEKDGNGSRDLKEGNIFPGIASSSASFVSTSTSSTNLLTPPLLDSPPLHTNSTNSKFDQMHIPSSSHSLPEDLSALLEKPLILGHGLNGGYGFAGGNVGGLGGGNVTSVVGTGKSGNRHSEFGWDTNQNWRYTSQFNPDAKEPEEKEPPYRWLLTTYLSYLIMILLGHLRDFMGKRFNKSMYEHLQPKNGYAALMSDFDSFYTRRLKLRLDDCFSRPTTGVAGRTVICYDRETTDEKRTFNFTGGKTRALNISSYNYLGFAQASGGCADAVETAIKKYGVSAGGARLEGGTLDLHLQAEKLVTSFLGTEDAMVVSMGFATNSTTIPALVDRGCLVISDEFNHSSIRFGVRLSGASVRSFKHNDMKALETLLRESISQGQPRTHRPWKKILVIVEGLYSMEGSMVHLPELIVLKERYKFYLYVDEAHSIGALGPNGRGVCDYFGVDPRSVDILMGTFTKSFGASGGYIGGNKEVIDRLRIRSHAMCYAEAMSPPVLTQIISSMASIMGVSPPLTAASTSSPIASSSLVLHHSNSDTDINLYSGMNREPGPLAYGPTPSTLLPNWMTLPPALMNGTEGRERLRRLAFNARYLSSGLRKLGFIVSGHRDSPIVPLFLFNPGKMPMFSRMMLERVGKDRAPVVVVVVAYPATPLISSRVRFCVSAAHTKHDIDLILRACDEIGDLLDLKNGKNRWTIDEVVRRAEELVHSN